MEDAVDPAKTDIIFGEALFDEMCFEVGGEELFVLEDAFIHINYV